jgi:hypothetical protein
MTLASYGLLGSPLGQLLGGQANTLAHILSSGGSGGLGGLPRPADLIQQAQALQLLAHLQTVLLQQAPGGGPGRSAGPGHPSLAGHPYAVGPGQNLPGQQQHPASLFSPDMQKVLSGKSSRKEQFMTGF